MRSFLRARDEFDAVVAVESEPSEKDSRPLLLFVKKSARRVFEYNNFLLLS